jgi:hypothetical protein
MLPEPVAHQLQTVCLQPSALPQQGLLLLSYTTPRDAASSAPTEKPGQKLGFAMNIWRICSSQIFISDPQ